MTSLTDIIRIKIFEDPCCNLSIFAILSFIPSFSFPDVPCDPTDLICSKGIPFEAAPSSDGLLAEVFCGFPQL